MKKGLLILVTLISLQAAGQELFVFTEPASNMPAHSISTRLADYFVARDRISGRFSDRLMPQLMFGLSRKFMFHVSATWSNMHTPHFRYESASLYAKYRFLAKDEIHKHFRMALFAEASATKAPFQYDEITLLGDKGGIGAGLIATQLWNKFALSGTFSHTQLLDRSRTDKLIYTPARNYQAMNYAISAGYLLFPREYTAYNQVNLNLYTEILAQQTLDRPTHYIDMAPGLQLIFNSNAKLNIGYRFQLSGTMQRASSNSWLISFERTFLNAF